MIRNAVFNALRGFCMGAADVVPGVSGGTMALVLGIYTRLMYALRSFDLTLVRLLMKRDLGAAVRHVDLLLLLPLGVGIAAALGFFTRIVPLPQLLQTDPEPIYGLFSGLVLASIAVLIRGLGRLRAGDLLAMAGGVLFGLVVVTRVPTNTPETAAFVFFSGMIAITAMLLPGISGSFILLILRKYAYVFDAIGHLKLAIVLPFLAGCVAGVLVFSRTISWLLEHHQRRTLAAIVGILTASMYVIWPFQERQYVIVREKSRLISSEPRLPVQSDDIVLTTVAVLIGFMLVLVLHHFAHRKTADA
ncbi:MAG: DUF368 domain-containing protein [Gammaproteobacteria bacterium]|nr:DUF368 domain-containing protein [Gammaproteobacteria bacterium]